MSEFVLKKTHYSNCKFTIAIPTFKRADLLREAVISALKQSYINDYEVLVADNNPERNDETELCMQEFYNNPRISYYKNKENIGMCGNWNKMYEMAQGKYVVQLHDDDLLSLNYLEVMDYFIKKTNERFDVIYPYLKMIKERCKPETMAMPDVMKYRIIKPQDFATGNIVGIPSGMILKNTSFKNTIGPFDNRLFPALDNDFASRAALKGNVCYLMHEMVYYWIGVNASGTEDLLRTLFRIWKDLRKCHEERMPWYGVIASKLCYRGNIINYKKLKYKFFPTREFVDKIAYEESGFKELKVLDFLSRAFRWFIWKLQYSIRKKQIIYQK